MRERGHPPCPARTSQKLSFKRMTTGLMDEGESPYVGTVLSVLKFGLWGLVSL